VGGTKIERQRRAGGATTILTRTAEAAAPAEET